MPLLRIFTTLPRASVTEAVVLATSKMFAEAIHKPEAKCAVQYVPDQIISHGGIFGNAAQSKFNLTPTLAGDLCEDHSDMNWR